MQYSLMYQLYILYLTTEYCTAIYAKAIGLHKAELASTLFNRILK